MKILDTLFKVRYDEHMKDDRIENVDSPFWKQYESWEQWKDISQESLYDKLIVTGKHT